MADRRRGRVDDVVGKRVLNVQTTLIGETEIRLLADDGQTGFSAGSNRFWLEFRVAGTGEPVAVSDLRVSASMNMPGMVMHASVSIEPAGVGLYRGSAELGMAGTWRWSLEWRGSRGLQSATFDGDVR